MCICINCRHIYNCLTYQFVSVQHNKPERSISKCFIPNKTVLNVNVSKEYNNLSLDWDITECLSFSEKPGSWSIKT